MDSLSYDILGMIGVFMKPSTFALISKAHLHVYKRFVCKVCKVITSPIKNLCSRCGLVKEDNRVRLIRQKKIHDNVSHKDSLLQYPTYGLVFFEANNQQSSIDPFIIKIRKVNHLIEKKRLKNQIF